MFSHGQIVIDFAIKDPVKSRSKKKSVSQVKAGRANIANITQGNQNSIKHVFKMASPEAVATSAAPQPYSAPLERPKTAINAPKQMKREPTIVSKRSLAISPTKVVEGSW